ncbi:cyclase family protein [soil metagenome]
MPGPTTGMMLHQNVTVFDLEQPRFQGMPIHESHQPGYVYSLHRRHADGLIQQPESARSGASGIIVCMEHSGTHIDALCHQSEDQMLHGGIPAASVSTSRGFTRHGVEEIPPLIAPGILLDVARHRGVQSLEPGDAVTATELQQCAEERGVSIDAGSIVLVRTGNDLHWNQPAQFLPGPGMDGSVSRWLAEMKVLAVGSDTMAWDVIGLKDPDLGFELPGHALLLVRAGIYIIENLFLQALAAAEAWRFSFICTPLKFTGATGSPVRPIAIVSS